MKRMGKKKSNIKESRIVEIEIQQYSDERMNVDNNGAKKTHTHIHHLKIVVNMN